MTSYLDHLKSKRFAGRRVSAHHCRNVEHNLRRLIRECRVMRLTDLSRRTLEQWLREREDEGMSARTRNAHQAAIVAFGNWCVDTHRLTSSPFNRMPKANEKADQRRARRAMTEVELRRLLEVARSRPLMDAMTVRRGKRKGQLAARVTEQTKRQPDLIGRERALIYKTLLLTGLRKGELASLTVGQLELDHRTGGIAFVVLKAQHEKAGRGADIPLRDDLVADLRHWLVTKLELAQERARERGEPLPVASHPRRRYSAYPPA